MFETNLHRIKNKSNSNNFIKEVELIQFKGETDFWVKEFGFFGVILENVLIENKLVELLQKYVPEQVNLTPTKVIRRATNEILGNYSILELYNELTLEDFDRDAFKGFKIFWFNGSIYVSDDLKKIIEKEFIDAIKLDFDNSYPFMA